MTKPGTIKSFREYAVARYSGQKLATRPVTSFATLCGAWHPRFSAVGKWVLLPITLILVLSYFGESSFAAAASEPLKLDGTTSRYNLQGHLEVYQDKVGTESFKSVEYQKFSPTDKAVPNYAFTRSAYWIKLAVENTTSKVQTLLLQVANPYLDFIDIFVKSDRNATIDRYRAGACRPMDKKLIRGREPVSKLLFKPGETKTIFLGVKSGTSLRVPLSLSTEKSYHDDELKRYMLLGLFYGVLGFLIIFNIFGWSILKQRAYFYYIWLLIGLALCELSYDGLIPEVTIFSRPELIQHLFNSGIGLTFIFNTLFASSFMDARTKYPILYRIFDVFLVLAVFNTILFVVLYYAGNFMALLYGPLLACALALVTGLIWYKGESHVRYLFMGHVQFPIIAAAHVGMMLGILPFYFMLAEYGVKFGYLWQGMFLSLALADRYSIMQRNFQHVLENKVTERSAALVEANEKLQREMAERKRGEKAITKAKREWEETFDTVPDLIAIIDRNHVIQRLNKAMASKLELHPREAIGRKCYEFCHGTDRPYLGCPLLQSVADGEEHSAEVNEPKLEGTFLVSVTPMKTNGFQPDRFVHVARDITERKTLKNGFASWRPPIV